MKYPVIIIAILWALSVTTQARQSCDWPFRTSINITEQSGTTLSDYQVKLTINTTNISPDYVWTVDGYDFRIFDSDDTTALEFWIESWNQASQTATVWVRFPSTAPLQANQTRNIFLYYGNEGASPLANVPFTFIEPGIKFHARPTSYNPSNKTDAFNEFNSIADNGNNNDGYGCTFITNFTGITKNGEFGNGDNFAALSESYFEVKAGEEGLWEFRYGADFGRGGALYVDDTALEEDWNNDLWWSNSWTNADRLEGSITLSSGYHKLEVIGYEGCCDGGITVQFKRPGGNWTTFTTSDIDIRSRACPVTEPIVSFNALDTCELVDLRVRNNGLAIPSAWEVNVSSDIVFAIRNTNNGNASSVPNIPVTVTLPNNFTLNSSSGTGWSCSQTGSLVNCNYSSALAQGDNSEVITLNITPNSSATVGADNINIEVFTTYYDVSRTNNSVNQATTLVDNDAIAPVTLSCMTPQSGVLARFFDIETYSDTNIQTEAEMQLLIDNRANETYVDGQTILTSINSNGNSNTNPFDDRNDEYFLTLLQGYLKIPTTDYYTFGVDGDDAVEFRLNGNVISHFYGLHGTNGSPQDQQQIRLAAGYHEIEFRMQELTGGAAFILYWDSPSTTTIPSDKFFHCAGDVTININSSVSVISDPINGTTQPKAIPGAVLQQTVTAINQGNISTDDNSVVISQAIASGNTLYVNDLAGNGPITFTNDSIPANSGLSYVFTALTSNSDSLEFSDDSGATYTYSPTPDGNGYDSNVTNFRLNLQGSFKPKVNSNEPGFNFIYQVLVD